MMVGSKIMNMRIDSRSTIGSNCATSQRQHIQTETSCIDFKSALTASNSHKI
jgi:hypothetical protein